ncbi:MAG: glutathione S-transferase family protein [Leucothrix sp.]
MTNYKLTYFDFDGGRAEPVRIAFHAAGIEFEDHRFSFPEFAEIAAKMPFKAVPALAIDGTQITQSNAMGRYVGKMAGLYPQDDMQALYCDEVMDALEDLTHELTNTFGMEGDALKAAREKLAEGAFPTYIRGLDELLKRGGGEYFADNQLTMADLKSFVVMSSLTSGHLDHIPADIVERVAPDMVAHIERVKADPRVAAYYASRA